MDGGAWRATVHEVANNQTQLSDFTFFLSFFLEKEMATHSKILAWTSLGQNSLSGYIGHRLAKSRTQLSD